MTSRKQLADAWWRIPVAIRKPLVLMVGSVIIVVGIFMLVFPGPGWAAIFLGFAVLATEFAFAVKIRDWLISLFKRLLAWFEKLLKRIFR